MGQVKQLLKERMPCEYLAQLLTTTLLVTLIMLATLLIARSVKAQGASDDSDAKPPVAKVDLEIVKRATEILDSPSKWNRADNRVCPETAKTFSLYCALEKATTEKTGSFAHRGAAMQEARFVIEEIAPNVNYYEHWLRDYNNDPTTTFAGVQKFFDVLEDHIAKRLAGQPIEMATPASATATARPRPVTTADIEVLQRARDILDSPAKWNRHDDQNCETQTNAVSLYCAIKTASKEVPGNSGAVMQEARGAISEMDPKELKYKTRLTDYNNDPAVTFADLQKFFEEIEVRLTRRLGAGAK
jgi:hypothetical protein